MFCLLIAPQIIIPECALMKSKKMPQRIVFENSDSHLGMAKKLNKVAFIFKTGDDLRQDSLVLQMIRCDVKLLYHPVLWTTFGRSREKTLR